MRAAAAAKGRLSNEKVGAVGVTDSVVFSGAFDDFSIVSPLSGGGRPVWTREV